MPFLRKVVPAALTALLTVIGAVTPFPAEAEGAAEGVQPGQSKESAQAQPSEERPSSWYFFWAPSNVHPRLYESEAKINHQINDTIGRLIPGWDRPTTFKDQSGEFKLWDLHLGVGRHLTPKVSAFLDFGGTVGKARNNDNYWLLLPLKSRIDFGRTVWFVATGVDWYPWGKPYLDPTRGRTWFVRAIKGSKPFFEAATGYVHLKETAKVKLGIRDSLTFLKEDQTFYHNVFYGSPRIGVETPLTKNDSLSLKMGYLFFTQHPDDFNSLAFYIQHSHRF